MSITTVVSPAQRTYPIYKLHLAALNLQDTNSLLPGFHFQQTREQRNTEIQSQNPCHLIFSKSSRLEVK